MRKVLSAAVSALAAVTIALFIGPPAHAAPPPTPGAFLAADPVGRYVVVLGARMDTDGSPPEILRERLDRAAGLYRDNPRNRIIVTGGNTWWLPIPEATFMHVQLVARGVPPQRVLDESTAMSTVENAQKVVAMLKGLNATGAVIVTNDFHMDRAMRNFRTAAGDQHTNLTFAGAIA